MHLDNNICSGPYFDFGPDMDQEKDPSLTKEYQIFTITDYCGYLFVADRALYFVFFQLQCNWKSKPLPLKDKGLKNHIMH